MRVDQHGQMLGLLRPGEQKSLQTDRVILVPGPADEIATVDRIYRLFVEDGKTEAQIAEILNGAGTATDLRRPWTRGSVHQVLSNEKYIGNNVYNRVSFKLKKRRVTNPPAMWVRADQAFEAVVEPPLFYAAQGIIRERSRQVTPADPRDPQVPAPSAARSRRWASSSRSSSTRSRAAATCGDP